MTFETWHRHDAHLSAGFRTSYAVLYFLFGSACVEAALSLTSPLLAQPILYDVHVKDIPDDVVPRIKPWKRVVLDKAYGDGWVVLGDLTGNGQIEIVTARCLSYGDAPADNHYTTAVAAHRLDGSLLWKWGDFTVGGGSHGDVGCQIYDWDGDGKNEVIVAAKEQLVELDGASGAVKRSFPIPPDASDCIVFCNLSGHRRATDVLVKTRYSQIWAYNYEGEQLWTAKHPGGYMTAHQARPIDLDGDRKDEVLAGFAMLNSDGTLRWVLDGRDPVIKVPFEPGLEYHTTRHGHLDCGRVLNNSNVPADVRLVLTFCTGERIAKTDGNGRFSWSVTGRHFESIDVGKVCEDVPGKQIVVDIPYAPEGEKPVWVMDENGVLLGQILTNGSRFHRLVDWTGDGVEEIVVGTDHCMFDGSTGKKVGLFELSLQTDDKRPAELTGLHCEVGDMTGDGIVDVVYYANRGTVICIYKNEKGKPAKDAAPLGMKVNTTLY